MTATYRTGNLATWNLRRLALGLVLVLVSGACSKTQEVVVETAEAATVEPEPLNAQQVDAEPLALLPAGAMILASLDVTQTWGKPVGERVGRWIESRLPLPPAAGFVPRRDLRRLMVGFYSVQSEDVVGVAEGNFDVDAIDASADGKQLTALGSPLVRVSYAGQVFYVSGSVGFAVLTPNTVLFGNEFGLRRALDRLQRRELTVEIEPLLIDFIKLPGGPIGVGVNEQGAAALRAVRSWQPLDGLRLARVVGDFRAPGLHFAGSLTYQDDNQAVQSQDFFDGLGRNATALSTLGSLFGYGSGLAISSTHSQGSVQVVGRLDEAWAGRLMDLLERETGGSPSPKSQSVVPSAPQVQGSAQAELTPASGVAPQPTVVPASPPIVPSASDTPSEDPQ